MDASAELAAPFAADVDFPVVLDSGHLLGELFGVVNVPAGIWVDESGTVVRPPETAYPARPSFLDLDLDDPKVASMPAPAVARLRTVQPLLKAMRIDPEGYVAALRDWVSLGADSRFGLSADEVLERSRPRPVEQAQAAAAFALGQHLQSTGRPDAAVRWFRESHRLQPDNWTYRRQAWSLVDRSQGPTGQYDSDWLTDVQREGGANYYEPVELEPRRPR
jgi:hypothetical protein